VEYTIINGQVVYRDGVLSADLPIGQRIQFNR
jgi:hypothetical protein